jgi:hypothetical protein
MVGIGDGDPLISLRFSDTVSEGVLEGQLKRLQPRCLDRVYGDGGSVPRDVEGDQHE